MLRSWAYGESDKIVSFLTRDFGKLRGIAKGAKRSRKRFLNVLEPFTLVQLRFHQRSNSPLAFVHACDWVYVFRELTRTLGKIAHASYLVEITDELTRDGDESLSLFTHLRDGLRFLEGNEASTEFLTAFELTLLRLAGYQPTLEHCQRCGATPAAGDGREQRLRAGASTGRLQAGVRLRQRPLGVQSPGRRRAVRELLRSPQGVGAPVGGGPGRHGPFPAARVGARGDAAVLRAGAQGGSRGAALVYPVPD